MSYPLRRQQHPQVPSFILRHHLHALAHLQLVRFDFSTSSIIVLISTITADATPIIVAVVVAGIAVCIIIVIVVYRRIKAASSQASNRTILASVSSNYAVASEYPSTELKPKSISLGPQIGQGAYGTVRLAHYTVSYYCLSL